MLGLAARPWPLSLAYASWRQLLPSVVASELNREACLAFLAQQLPGGHVAAKTALAWQGVRHNLSYRETVVFWGDQPARLGLAPLTGGHPELPVCSPERALLELLSESGSFESLEEVRQLVESTRNLRLPQLDQLLSHLTRIKVVRLAALLAGELALPWAVLLGGRWSHRGTAGSGGHTMNGAYIATRALTGFARASTKDRPLACSWGVLRISTSAGRSSFATSLRIMDSVSGRCLFITSEIRPLLPITPSRSFRDRPRCSSTNSIAAIRSGGLMG